jgi:hypothetical protein
MRNPLSTLILLAALGLNAGVVAAADIARLEWGGFVVQDDSSNGWDEFKSVASDDGRSIKITFSSLDAKADGGKLEDRAKFSGHYDVVQPVSDSFSRFVATVEGHVIKSGAAVTRLVVVVGSVEKIIEWPAGENASEKFSRSLDIVLPGEGRLPNPFLVSVETYARKDGQADAAYVSVDQLTITAANPQVAGFQNVTEEFGSSSGIPEDDPSMMPETVRP